MKKIVFIIVSVLCSVGILQAQESMEQGLKLPNVRALESQGWKVQHSLWSFDSLTIYFSAQAPDRDNYDLFTLHSEGWQWSEPQRINGLSRDRKTHV